MRCGNNLNDEKIIKICPFIDKRRQRSCWCWWWWWWKRQEKTTCGATSFFIFDFGKFEEKKIHWNILNCLCVRILFYGSGLMLCLEWFLDVWFIVAPSSSLSIYSIFFKNLSKRFSITLIQNIINKINLSL